MKRLFWESGKFIFCFAFGYFIVDLTHISNWYWLLLIPFLVIVMVIALFESLMNKKDTQ